MFSFSLYFKPNIDIDVTGFNSVETQEENQKMVLVILLTNIYIKTPLNNHFAYIYTILPTSNLLLYRCNIARDH